MAYKEERISTLLKNLAANFLERESSRTSLITVTGISISKDFKKADILISVLPERDEDTALAFAKRKRSDLRDFIKKQTRMRVLPFFDFKIDRGERNRQRIDELSNNS